MRASRQFNVKRHGFVFAATMLLGVGLTACSNTDASTSSVFERSKAKRTRVAFLSPDEQRLRLYKNVLHELKSTNNPPPSFDYNAPPAQEEVAFQPAVSEIPITHSYSVEADTRAALNLALTNECLRNQDYAGAASNADEMIENAKLAGNPQTISEAEFIRSKIWETSGY